MSLSFYNKATALSISVVYYILYIKKTNLPPLPLRFPYLLDETCPSKPGKQIIIIDNFDLELSQQF